MHIHSLQYLLSFVSTDSWALKMFSWLPNPTTKEDSEEYLPFDEVYGKEATYVKRPGLVVKGVPSETDKTNKSNLTAGKVSCTVTTE